MDARGFGVVIHYLPSLALRLIAFTAQLTLSRKHSEAQLIRISEAIPKQVRVYCTKWDGCGTGLYLLKDGTLKRSGGYIV